MTDKVPVITIDGPVGAGKGAIAQRLAERLGFHLLDSGALYRVLAVAAAKEDIRDDDADALGSLAGKLVVRFEPSGDPDEPLDVILDEQEVTQAIRTNEAGEMASRISPLTEVRMGLRDLQRSFRRSPGLVADGRDMGTVVFADAVLKIYLTASAEVRAERRYKQLKHKDIGVSLHALLESIRERDERDMQRAVAPLRPADDAFTLDSTDLDIDAVLAQVMNLVRQRGIID
ncbi:MAG: (d)CMP kinase [Pseudomonadales bacterium]|nr:(d)CMP kinase [Pseudomonadales bacterium]MDP7595423.1 (d)CMP kinase [Pseudomonadales bacterium]HJN49656.1 (d)CMP kinase [Pseudomonadales bacterium]